VSVANVGGRLNRWIFGLTTLLVAATSNVECHAACRPAPLDITDSFFSAMDKRMTADYGLHMKTDSYDARHTHILTVDFNDALTIIITDHQKKFQLLALNNVAVTQIQTLATAAVSYFTKYDESEIAPEIKQMIQVAIAASPSREDILNPDFVSSTVPVATKRWGKVELRLGPATIIPPSATYKPGITTLTINFDGVVCD